MGLAVLLHVFSLYWVGVGRVGVDNCFMAREEGCSITFYFMTDV